MRAKVWGCRGSLAAPGPETLRYGGNTSFPVTLSQIGAEVSFHDAPDEPWALGGVTVTAANVAHQGPTLGYRLADGHALAYIPDHEPSIGVDLRSLGSSWISGHAIARAADVPLHDSQYSEDEYPDHVGWGHCSIEHVVTFARLAGVRRLVLFHHDPLHGDDALDELCARARQLWDGPGAGPELAYEGMEIDLAISRPQAGPAPTATA